MAVRIKEMKVIYLTLFILINSSFLFSNDLDVNINKKIKLNNTNIEENIIKSKGYDYYIKLHIATYNFLNIFPITNLLFITYWYPSELLFIPRLSFPGLLIYFPSLIISGLSFIASISTLSAGGYNGPIINNEINPLFVSSIITGSISYLINLIYGLFIGIGQYYVLKKNNINNKLNNVNLLFNFDNNKKFSLGMCFKI